MLARKNRSTTRLEALVRPNDLARLLGVSRSTLARLVRRGDLPRPIRITPGAVAWRSSDIAQFVAHREGKASR